MASNDLSKNPASGLSPEFTTKLALDSKHQQPSKDIAQGLARGAGTIVGGFLYALILV